MYTQFKYQGKSVIGEGGDVVLVHLSPYGFLPIALLTNIFLFLFKMFPC
jgi:hypothetical protein